MKLSYFQLEPHLKKNLSPIYIVSGEELLLKQEALLAIRETAKQAGFIERIRLSPDAGYEWEKLHTLLNAASLLAEQQLIEIDFHDSAPNKIASKIMQEYGQRPSSQRILVIDIGKIDNKIAKSPWFQALEKNGILVTIWPIPREQLPQWILQRVKKYQLSINQPAAQLLTDYVEGNLVAAAQAIEKLSLLSMITINEDTIRNIFNDESRFTIFDFVEALIAQDKSRTLPILETLKAEKTEPTLILWGITRELRLLASLAAQLKQGLTYENLFQQHRVYSRRQTAIRNFLKNHSEETCWELLTHAAEIDRSIKGALPGNPWDRLQLFCLRVGSGVTPTIRV